MGNKFELIRSYLLDLGYHISGENKEEQIFIISEESKGISNLILDCEEPLLIFEQFIGEIKTENIVSFKKLLQINRQLVHGAFVLDDQKNLLFFRDTLELENLDKNEVEGTLLALSLAMAEYGTELVKICK